MRKNYSPLLLLTVVLNLLSCTEINKSDNNLENQNSSTTTTPPNIEEDLRRCFAKAIALAEGIDLSTKLNAGERLNLNEDFSSSRIDNILRKISARSNGFDPNQFPPKITLNYEDCMFSELEWEITYQGNRKYKIKFEYCVNGDFVPKGGFLLVYDLNQDQYRAQFDVWQLTAVDEEMETTTKITIENDKVTLFDRESKPQF